MYRFQICASTQVGESIGLVGSTPALGQWNIKNCIRLHTSAVHFPRWWTDPLDLSTGATSSNLGIEHRVEYKYVRFGADGSVQWESIESNRWVPIETDLPSTLTVDDGDFGYGQPYPYGYLEQPIAPVPLTKEPDGLKIVVIGSSVALGCNAWLLKGWAWHLEQVLHQKYGHQLVNRSEVGANVSTTIDRFPLVVAPEQPDIVIIALSLGNEGLASCPPHQRRAVQRRFESGLQQLVKMTQDLGAQPILSGVYPHGDYLPEHEWLLRDTHRRMMAWDIPVLDWLAAVEDGRGRWKAGISFNPAHPNSKGHRLMYEAIDLNLFQIGKDKLTQAQQSLHQKEEIPIYRDNWGFHVFACPKERSLRFINASKHPYSVSSSWQDLQTVLRNQAQLLPGLYLTRTIQNGIPSAFSVGEDGAIETPLEIPAAADLEYHAAFHFFSPKVSQILFYDGQVGILQEDEHSIRILNETNHEYNIHPMWREVRSALKMVSPRVYHDPAHPDIDFRTLMIGKDGLESRVKIPAKSSVLFHYQCELSDINRVAIIPLGDRCAIRMLLYKMEYDGPAFPFDLTRTTHLADVADMIETGFQEMWNPGSLRYSHDAGRIYHTKWTGLSFAHEVEDTDDPLHNMFPVYERMRSRYAARASRFWYTVQNCDKALFVRTGITDRATVIDLLQKLEKQCQGKPFRLLLISPQSSDQFFNLPNVLHHNLEFNPDRMYEDLGYWKHCTEVMHGILTSLGVSSKNLFWCPPNPPKA